MNPTVQNMILSVSRLKQTSLLPFLQENPHPMSRLLLLLLLLVGTAVTTAQSGSDNPICLDDTCSEELDNINLNEPRDPVGGV